MSAQPDAVDTMMQLHCLLDAAVIDQRAIRVQWQVMEDSSWEHEAVGVPRWVRLAQGRARLSLTGRRRDDATYVIAVETITGLWDAGASGARYWP
jgi:hypothetical protein